MFRITDIMDVDDGVYGKSSVIEPTPTLLKRGVEVRLWFGKWRRELQSTLCEPHTITVQNGTTSVTCESDGEVSFYANDETETTMALYFKSKNSNKLFIIL